MRRKISMIFCLAWDTTLGGKLCVRQNLADPLSNTDKTQSQNWKKYLSAVAKA
ncbi:hypothetical protein [Thiomonas sp. FB-Cd]|uniref:hypothetical protein n=1 Tax=Thiomonas sp. FB-Cd TaxID=1158292 RepID=UPI000AFB7F78|nr:hypothetical protein [Thiomonas sp. FB-Cd]